MVNTPAPKRILTMLDFDDCLFPHTINYYLPVLRDMLKAEIRRTRPGLTEAEYTEGERLSLSRYGSYFKHWHEEIAPNDPDWTRNVYMPMLAEQVKAVKANLKPDLAVAEAIRKLVTQGHTIYIVTHGHIDYCWPLVQFAGLEDDIPKSHIIDLERTGYQTKSSGAPYRLVQELEGQPFDIINMADDVVANLRPLRAMGILGHLVSETVPAQEDKDSFDIHHTTILDALRYMAGQSV